MSPAHTEFGGLTFPVITELVWLNFKHAEAGHHAQSHLHHFFQLDVVLAGERLTRVEDMPQRALHRGDAVLIPPLYDHEFWSDPGFKHASIKLHLNWRLWNLLARRAVFFRPSGQALAILEDAGEQYVAQRPFALERVVAASTLCLVDLMVTAGEAEESAASSFDDFRGQLLPLLERISREPDAIWTVESMAEACHLSTSRFSHCFKQVLGRSPQQFVMEARLRAAASELLQQPGRSIKSVAQLVGYGSVHAFTRAFQRLFNIGPAGYRKLWSTRYRPTSLISHSPLHSLPETASRRRGAARSD